MADPMITRRLVLAGALAAGFSVAGGLPASATGVARPRRGYVHSQAGRLWIGGRPWHMRGTNCYYLHQVGHDLIDDVLDDAAAMGLTAVRAWGFADGTARASTPLQPEAFVYDDDAFDSLDYAVAAAGRRGLRLVLPLVNNWPDYGGMAQYVSWILGLPDDSYGDSDGRTTNHDRFYTDATIRNCYRSWARHFVNHRNTYAGLRYNADPTIAAFELANEPRCRSDASGDTLTSWAAQMSRYVSSLAPHQMVAVGDEGFLGRTGDPDFPYSGYDGVDWPALIALPAVDYGSVHLYPENWGGPSSADPVGWGVAWIKEHRRIAAKARTPMVLGEFGLSDHDIRDDAYRQWTQASGDWLVWMLTAQSDTAPTPQDYRIYYPSSTASVLSDAVT